MVKKKISYSFRAKLEPMKGAFISTVVYLPEKIVDTLPAGRVRTEGELNGVPFALSPQHKKDGRRFFTVSGRLRNAAGVKEGDAVQVSFRLVDPDAVNLPAELEAVLEQDDKALELWRTLSSGMQRNFIIYVNGASGEDTRIRRALQSIEKLKRQPAYFQRGKKKK